MENLRGQTSKTEKNRASGSRNTCTAIKRHGASRRCAGAKFLRSSPVLNADRGPRKALFASSTPVHPPCFLSERSPPTLAIVIRCFVALRAVFSRFSPYNESVSADEAAIKRNDVNSVSRHRPSFYVRYFELQEGFVREVCKEIGNIAGRVLVCNLESVCLVCFDNTRQEIWKILRRTLVGAWSKYWSKYFSLYTCEISFIELDVP